MSAAPRGTASQYSKGTTDSRGVISRLASGIAGGSGTLRWALAAVGLAGAVLLIVSEFADLTQVKVITVVLKDSSRTGFDQNSGAMLILGAVALPMLFGAARAASRPAMVAVGVLGLIALLIALIGDLPDVTKVGTIFQDRYEDAKAEPQIGFYLETLGAVLLLLSGAAMLLVEAGARRDAGEAEAPPDSEPEPSAKIA
jgi:hypothetical protein